MSSPPFRIACDPAVARILAAVPTPLAHVAGEERRVLYANPAFAAVAGEVAPGTPLAALFPGGTVAPDRWTVRLPAGAFRVRVGERDGFAVAALEREPGSEFVAHLAHVERLATFGRLAAGIVHDLRGPLTAIRVAAEALLSRYALDPAAAAERDKARRIVDSGERVLGMVRGLLAYARPSPEAAEPIDAGLLVEDALGLCAHVAESRGATLVGTAEPNLAVIGRRLPLEQVLVNLVTNACQAVGPGGRVEVLARAAGTAVEFEIRDDGPGIAPEHVARIFEPFFTARAGDQGTGLGLSIVREIVAAHGGTVAVESAPGCTRFFVSLPGRRG